MRLGLCCLFHAEPIKFVTTTATAMSRLPREASRARLSQLCLTNAEALQSAINYCADHGIGCFRVNSHILPLKTHPTQGYDLADLPEADEIEKRFRACGAVAQRRRVRTCFHPDQFVVLNSPRADVVASSLTELEYQAEVAEWINADVVNIHAGGAYGDKQQALADFARVLPRLSARVRRVLTVENDDRLFAPADLLPLCQREGIPLVYDAHHHRCHPDGLSVEQATRRAQATWDREPLFHISSPIAGWNGPHPRRHHDFIDVADFPECWRRKRITVEVEAKAKEVAVLRLLTELAATATPSVWTVYILRCADGSLYTGIATDVVRRCDEHNSGTGAAYTRSRRPATIVYQETQANRSQALRREAAIKTLSRRQKEALISEQAV